ncbi:CHAT domain-containing protein [Flavobacterium columnare]|uniref:CHAT domain-containing protein n=1 Tax=Flavobacterium columnare TaxID=996 RepID=A0AA94F3E6_9FLAO|nr:CHAT domain-containing protein [Flavobacterium columnare]MCH4834025.1 CHAT domain-containing protein [Flavobacterium columnare]
MIKIPHNRAIQLLEQRLSDVDSYNVDLKALQSRIKQDIETIFGRGSTQSITAITLDTLHFDKPEKLAACKTNFRQTIKGWIEFIKDYNLIKQEQTEIQEQEYKDKYESLLERWNNLVPDYNKLLEDYEDILKKYDEALSWNETLQNRLDNKSELTEMIKILFLGASPIDEVKLRIDEEVREIETGLKLAKLRDQFELKSEWAVTNKTLQQAMLDESPTIVHFSGHGDIDGIALEDTLGNSKLIDTDAISSLFELFSKEIKCVILNSCYSESQAREISKHVPYVIGMKSSIGDKTAIAFSLGFYTALGAGKDIDFAYRMGIVSIKLEGETDHDIPILIKK